MAVLGAYCNLSVDFPLPRGIEGESGRLKLRLRTFFNWAATLNEIVFEMQSFIHGAAIYDGGNM